MTPEGVGEVVVVHCEGVREISWSEGGAQQGREEEREREEREEGRKEEGGRRTHHRATGRSDSRRGDSLSLREGVAAIVHADGEVRVGLARGEAWFSVVSRLQARSGLIANEGGRADHDPEAAHLRTHCQHGVKERGEGRTRSKVLRQ